MDAEEKNEVTVAQLKKLHSLLICMADNCEKAEEKVVKAGRDATTTSNWNSSGLRGAQLLSRFFSGLVGTVEAAETLHLFDEIELLQKERVGESSTERVAKAMVAAEPASTYSERGGNATSEGQKDGSARKKRRGSD